DAHDRHEPVAVGGRELRGDVLVGLAVVLPALGVADDDVLRVERGEEGPRDLARVRAAVVRREILPAVGDRQVIRRHERLHAAQVGEGREDRDLDRPEVVLRVAQGPCELLNERDRLQVIEVHLPVAGDERGAGHLLDQPSTSNPGRSLPSRNSRLAPPPVEMCPNASSANPSCRTAAAESPPPTTARPSTSVSAWATARVPAANGSSSKTPIGPFQKTVAESRMAAANASADSGPMSRPSPSAPNGVDSIASAAATAVSAS